MTKHVLNQAFDALDFLQNYWQQQPVVLRELIPNFEDPITPEELAGLACEEAVESRLVTESEANRWQLEHGPLPENRFQTLPPGRWTVLVQAVDQWSEAVARLKPLFDFIPSWRIDDIMVSFAAEAGGVGPHFDYYDVFLLQGKGQRRWQVGKRCTADSALVSGSELGILSSFEAKMEVILNPGDALYIPPQFAHWGSSLGDSLCYSIGFRAPSLAEMLEGFSDSLIAQSNPSQRFVDPAPSLPIRSGEIIPSQLTESYQSLIHSISSPSEFNRWFGCYVTQPRYPELIAAPESGYDSSKLRQQLANQATLQRNPSSRFAFIECAHAGKPAAVLLFVDGMAHALPSPLLEAVAKLCALSTINHTEFEDLAEQEEMLELLLLLVNQGSLLLH